MSASEIMGNILISDEINQTDNLTRLSKYHLPKSVLEVLEKDPWNETTKFLAFHTLEL